MGAAFPTANFHVASFTKGHSTLRTVPGGNYPHKPPITKRIESARSPEFDACLQTNVQAMPAIALLNPTDHSRIPSLQSPKKSRPKKTPLKATSYDPAEDK